MLVIRTLFILASFFVQCVGTVGEMFFLLVICWSWRLFHLLQSTMYIMVLIPCLLVLASKVNAHQGGSIFVPF